MSRNAELIVLALDAAEVMEQLTRDDPTRSWKGRFVPVHSQWGASFRAGWAVEFDKMHSHTGLLADLESQPWPRPESVQVLIHDEEDDCFGLWMIHNGQLEEVSLPHRLRFHNPAPESDEYPPPLASSGEPIEAARYPSRLPRQPISLVVR